ncbi:CCD81 protein, partial [Halcyon senegalensis]|nr:CCD81 protein [Halcyon senegalensis]
AKMIKYLLMKPLRPDDFPVLKELTTSEICQIWDATSQYICRQLLEKKGVAIGIGTFALMSAHATIEKDEVLPVEKPIFQPCRFLKKFYQLKCTKTKIPDETPRVLLDFKHIATGIHFCPEAVEKCLHETLRFPAEALHDKKEVEFSSQ